MTMRRTDHRAGLPILIAVAAAAYLAVAAFRAAGALQGVELAAYDALLRLSASEAPSAPIVVAAAGEAEIARHGWPLSDAVLADVLAAIAAHGPRAVGVDIYRDRPVGAGAKRLADRLAADDGPVWTYKFALRPEDRIPPPDLLQGGVRIGFSDVVLDPDGVVRRGLLFLDDGQTVERSFALALALNALRQERIGLRPDPEEPSLLRLGATTLPPLEPDDGGYAGVDAAGYQILLDFRERPRSFPVVSLNALLDGTVDGVLLRDAVVLVGTISDSVKDHFQTPLDAGADSQTAGVQLQAAAVGQILRHARAAAAPIRPLSTALERILLAASVLIGGLAALTLRHPLALLAAVALGLSALAALGVVAFLQSIWTPTASAALGLVGAAALGAAAFGYQDQRQRVRLMSLFSRHVSKAVADEIWRRRDEILENGRLRPTPLEVTIMFADIKGFTSVAERHPPEVVVDWLNRFYAVMVDAVAGREGVLLNFKGDAILAAFGAPLPPDAGGASHARAATACALDMRDALTGLNMSFRRDDLPEIQLRIGLHTGPVVAGLMGAPGRAEFALVGDTVNTAARLETMADALARPAAAASPCAILVSEATRAAIGDDAYATAPAGAVLLKGKTQPIQTHYLIGRKEGD